MFTIKRDELKVVMERTFDAPHEAVFQAFVDSRAIPKWWGLRRHTTTVDKNDVRVGGVWRFVARDADGNEFAFHSVYKKIDPPSLVSSTFNFEGIPGNHELTQTATFESLDGKTKVTSTATYANVEDLDGMVASGMESGATESWDRLAELLRKGREAGMNTNVPVPEARNERRFAILAEGGQVQMPLTRTSLSSRFGTVADRFGVSWMISVAP